PGPSPAEPPRRASIAPQPAPASAAPPASAVAAFAPSASTAPGLTAEGGPRSRGSSTSMPAVRPPPAEGRDSTARKDQEIAALRAELTRREKELEGAREDAIGFRRRNAEIFDKL